MITLFEKYKNINDYSKSNNYITIDENILNDMKFHYDYKHDGSVIHFFKKDFHFATLFYEGTFLVIKHDGSLLDLNM